MSTYNRITQHPNTKRWEMATWYDDYFAPHVYGVSFPNDTVIYTTEMVSDKELKEFWADDVIAAIREYVTDDERDTSQIHTDSLILDFLDRIEKAYKKRWKEDPTSGHGAAEYYKRKFEI